MRFFWVFYFLLTPWAFAEYRVFKLQITSVDGTQSRTVLSTLDPDQYRGYYTVKNTERIFYTDTWMCKGRTSELPLCQNPKDATNEAAVLDTPEVPAAPPTSP